jgi:autotransporter-associated beta strand protein
MFYFIHDRGSAFRKQPSAAVRRWLGAAAVIFIANGSAAVAQTPDLNGDLQFQSGSLDAAVHITNGVNNYSKFMNSSSAGDATIANDGGATFFQGSSTAGNARLSNRNSGITIFTDTSSAGTASISGNDGVVQFFNRSAAANSTMTIISGGVAQFLDNSTAASASIINSGAYTEFFNQSSAGNATIVTSNRGTTLFLDSSSGGQARAITGIGAVFDLSSLTTNGMTVGSIEGAGTYCLGSRTLTVGGNNSSSTVSGVIADGGWSGGSGGSLVKEGKGTLTLTGANSYTGATTVNAGDLDITGSLGNTSGVAVNAGGTLSGTGLVGPTATTIMSGGALAPGAAGNATGMLTVAGSLAFQSGALYLVQVTPNGAASVTVNGAAALNGAVNAAFSPGSYVSKQYTILTATGGLGGTTFNDLVNTDLPTGASASLSYDANHVFLNLKPGFTAFTGLAGNAQSVAGALTGFFNSTGGIPAAFFGLGQSDLAHIDGEAATGAERGAFQLMNMFLGAMLDPFAEGGGNAGGPAQRFAADAQASLPPDISSAYARLLKAPAAPSFDQRWSVWGKAYGGSNSASGNVIIGSSNITASTFGVASGMDYRVTPNTVIGFALAGGGANWGLAQGLGGGKGEAFQAGIYGITHSGPAYLSAALAFTKNWFTTDRIALGDQLSAKFSGQSFGARIEGGYRIAVAPAFGVTPYAAVQAQNFHTPDYSETDRSGGGFGLSYGAMTATDVRTELGSRFDAPTFVGGMPLILRGRLAWAHDFVGNPSLNAAFQALPGASFTVNGAAIARDSALASAGAELRITPRLAVLAKFDGEFATRSQTYAGTATLRYTW